MEGRTEGRKAENYVPPLFFEKVGDNKVRFSYDIQNNIGKYDTNQLRIHPKHLRIIYMYESCTNERKFVTVLDNSRDFLSTIRYKLSFTPARTQLPK